MSTSEIGGFDCEPLIRTLDPVAKVIWRNDENGSVEACIALDILEAGLRTMAGKMSHAELATLVIDKCSWLAGYTTGDHSLPDTKRRATLVYAIASSDGDMENRP